MEDVWQITTAAEGRGRLFTDQRALVGGVRATGRTLGSELLLFALVDDHYHLVVEAKRRRAGRLAAALSCALEPWAETRLQAAHISPIEHRAHLRTMVRYCVRQPVKHGLPGHPAGWIGTCLADLVGARWAPKFTPQALAGHLPRLQPSAILAEVGLHPSSVLEAADDVVMAVGPSRVLDAACSALCTTADDSTQAGTNARAAAAQVLARIGVTGSPLANALGVSVRGAYWLRNRPTDPGVLALVRRRISFDHAVASAPPVQPSDRERRAIQRSGFV